MSNQSAHDLETPWTLSWNPICGIMYGPIPIGLLLLVPVLIVIRMA